MKLIQITGCSQCPRCRPPRDAFEDPYCLWLHRHVRSGPDRTPEDCPLEDAPHV